MCEFIRFDVFEKAVKAGKVLTYYKVSMSIAIRKANDRALGLGLIAPRKLEV